MHDFFTVALVNNKEEFIYKFFNQCWNEASYNNTFNDLLFINPSCFRIFAAKNHCSEEGVSQLIKALEQLQKINDKLDHCEAGTHTARLLRSVQNEILNFVYSASVDEFST